MLSKFIQAGPKSASLSDQLDEFFVLANRIQILVVFQLMQKLHILHQGQVVETLPGDDLLRFRVPDESFDSAMWSA